MVGVLNVILNSILARYTAYTDNYAEKLLMMYRNKRVPPEVFLAPKSAPQTPQSYEKILLTSGPVSASGHYTTVTSVLVCGYDQK